MALSVKAYINPDTNQQEIRRFAIDEGASANFGYLRQKIEQVFPSVRGKAFKLFWKGNFICYDLNFARFVRPVSQIFVQTVSLAFQCF